MRKLTTRCERVKVIEAINDGEKKRKRKRKKKHVNRETGGSHLMSLYL